MISDRTRIAIVTGASRGIGAAAAAALARQGMSVALLARDHGLLRETERRIRADGGTAAAIVCDVASTEQVNEAINRTIREIGPPTVLVNNAGLGGPFHTLDEVPDDEWELIFRTNVRSVFAFCRRLLPVMRDHGFGRVINIASVQAHTGAAKSSTYVASKHAVIGYTRSIAAEWGQYGITSNAISPGYIATRMGLRPESNPRHEEFVRSRIAARRLGSPVEIADAVAFLASEQAAYINGAVLTIDGGLLSNMGFDAEES